MDRQFKAEFGDESSLFRPDSGIGSDFASDCQTLATKESEETQSASHCKFEDPLSDPIVRLSLRNFQISSFQLINMSVKELNRRLSNCSPSLAHKLKRCRRTLKNRGYAKNCRIKRIAARNELEEANTKLMRENKELRHRNNLLENKVRELRSCQITKQGANNSAPVVSEAFTSNNSYHHQPHYERNNHNQLHSQFNCNAGLHPVIDQNGDFLSGQIDNSHQSSYTNQCCAEVDYLPNSITPNNVPHPHSWTSH